MVKVIDWILFTLLFLLFQHAFFSFSLNGRFPTAQNSRNRSIITRSFLHVCSLMSISELSQSTFLLFIFQLFLQICFVKAQRHIFAKEQRRMLCLTWRLRALYVRDYLTVSLWVQLKIAEAKVTTQNGYDVHYNRSPLSCLTLIHQLEKIIKI